MLTHGGLPESDALHWNDVTYRKIGDIVYRLMSGNVSSAEKAHNDFFDMKRHFMKDDFESKITELDAFRASRNMPGVMEMLGRVQRQVTTLKRVESIEQVSPEIPVFSVTAPAPVVVCSCGRKDPCQEAVQMSLLL